MLAALEELAGETRRVRELLEQRRPVPRGNLLELVSDFLAGSPMPR